MSDREIMNAKGLGENMIQIKQKKDYKKLWQKCQEFILMQKNIK